MNILADSSLPGLDAAFPAPFQLTKYSDFKEIPHLLGDHEVLLCRSTLKVNHTLLKNHRLQLIATASSGTDHLDPLFLKSQNIKIIDAKGCNATAVADYVIACLAYLKQQGRLSIKKAGIIGMGHVGSEVAKRLLALHFELVHYDPLKEKNNPLFQSVTHDKLYECDVLCIHAELHDSQPYPSINLINQSFLTHLKPGCVIINASRGGIIDEAALLSRAKSFIYCTDVYRNEPRINKNTLEMAYLCTPHIAGHSLEAKYAAVAIVSKKIHQFAGLTSPQYAQPPHPPLKEWNVSTPWEKHILSIYNPIEETLLLKNAPDNELTFLKIRTEHQNRHDFLTYFNEVPEQWRQLIGL